MEFHQVLVTKSIKFSKEGGRVTCISLQDNRPFNQENGIDKYWRYYSGYSSGNKTQMRRCGTLPTCCAYVSIFHILRSTWQNVKVNSAVLSMYQDDNTTFICLPTTLSFKLEHDCNKYWRYNDVNMQSVIPNLPPSSHYYSAIYSLLRIFHLYELPDRIAGSLLF